jgi:predicted nucleic acid-binding protein
MRVVNASPLIHLARVSLLELLRETRHGVTRVVVPRLVFDEVLRGASYDPTAKLVDEATRNWLTIVPTPVPHPDIDASRIDSGEIAVLSVAIATAGASVVLDDRGGRAEADRLGIPKTGTLRLLLDAKELGIISSVRTPLDHLRARGMRLSEAVWREVLALAGE